MKRLFLALVVSTAAVAHAQPALDHAAEKAAATARYEELVAARAESLKKSAKPDLEAAIKNAERALTAAKRGVINRRAPGIVVPGNYRGTITYPTPEAKKAAIADAEKALEAARSNLADYKAGRYVPPGAKPLLEADSLKLGQVGHVGSCRVFQVIDSSNALLEFYYAGDAQSLNRGDGVIVRVGREGGWVMFWLTARSTVGLVDGQATVVKEPLWVSGTKTYETSEGSKTVFQFEPITP